MPLSTYYPFKQRFYQSMTTSTAGLAHAVGIAARCRYVGAVYATYPTVSHTAVGAITVKTGTAAGVTIISTIAGLITTSTGDSATVITPDSTTTVFLNAGDNLVTTGSSVVGGQITHIVQEF